MIVFNVDKCVMALLSAIYAQQFIFFKHHLISVVSLIVLSVHLVSVISCMV